ncbi:hypothetical protein FORC065_1198 [Yersinia enterocolitica]|nr:hypothetical protein FORC065_1198 [Yersinia enterocolitica]
MYLLPVFDKIVKTLIFFFVSKPTCLKPLTSVMVISSIQSERCRPKAKH